MFDDPYNDDEIQDQLPKPRPVISRPGGKGRLLKYLLPLIPKHRLYCEVFGGGLALFLAKNPSDIEVINDIDQSLVSFYRVAKFHKDTLLDELDLVLNSRQEFNDYRDQPGLTEIQKAARWFIRNKLSFGGLGSHFAATRTSHYSRRSTWILNIQALNRRLDTTTIERLSWEKFLDAYDHATGFYFLDPPYFDAGGAAYNGWDLDEFLQFADRVQKLKGKWLVTFQDSPEARRAFKHCKITPIERPNGIGNNGKNPKSRIYRELIIQPKN